MVKSESEIRKMTKLQLKQWLTKHDQRLPPEDKRKPYYLDCAIAYFRLVLKQESAAPSRSRSKTVSNAKSKKKPTATRARRRHSLSPSPSLNRSKKKIIRVPRKTPTKQSPGLQRSIKKKRARVRRATADPANLQKELDAERDADINDNLSTDSENTGDHNNIHSIHNPEKMTIRNLQQWLDENNIDFVNGKRKDVYVNLVKDSLNLNSKKRHLSPNHKKYTSPKFKKCKKNGAPLPSDLRKSPLTPQDDEKTHSRISLSKSEKKKKSGGLLLTPALNKAGISKIDTPSKLAMREEIVGLLEFNDPLYPIQNKDKDTDSKITPGAPQEQYDVQELEYVLSDLRRENEPKKAQKSRVKVYDPDKDQGKGTYKHDYDRKEDAPPMDKKPESFINSIIAKFSPHKAASTKSIQNQVNDVLTATKKRRKSSYIAKRTVPSPASPQPPMFSPQFDVNNNYQQALDVNQNQTEFYDEPMSPAINDVNNDAIRRSQRLAHKQTTSPKIQHVYKEREAVSKRLVQQSESPKIQHFYKEREAINNLSPIPSPFEENEAQLKPKSNIKKQPKCKGLCRTLFNVLSIAIFGAAIGGLFAVFDGVSVANTFLEDIYEYVDSFNFDGERKVLFCDTGKRNTGGDDSIHCIDCPQNSVICMNGRVQCKTNYILQDNKCVLDGIVVKFAYNLNKQIAKILSERKGRYECGEMDGIEGYTMNQDELMSICDVFDKTKKKEAFEYFKKHILSGSSVVSVNSKGQYFSYKSIKSPVCRGKEWAITNMLGLVATFIIIVIVFAIWGNYKSKQRERNEIDRMITNVYNILEEFDKCHSKQNVPVDVIRQRMNARSNKLWKKVDVLIQKDAHILKSLRMVDGMQKRCWALSSVVRVSGNNNGFGIDLSQSQQTKFPQYSKRRMW